jgi:hypothetical protein
MTRGDDPLFACAELEERRVAHPGVVVSPILIKELSDHEGVVRNFFERHSWLRYLSGTDFVVVDDMLEIRNLLWTLSWVHLLIALLKVIKNLNVAREFIVLQTPVNSPKVLNFTNSNIPNSINNLNKDLIFLNSLSFNYIYYTPKYWSLS